MKMLLKVKKNNKENLQVKLKEKIEYIFIDVC